MSVSPSAERGEQQHAVGDALRAGQADRAPAAPEAAAADRETPSCSARGLRARNALQGIEPGVAPRMRGRSCRTGPFEPRPAGRARTPPASSRALAASVRGGRARRGRRRAPRAAHGGWRRRCRATSRGGCGDAREVAEAAGGEAEQAGRVAALGEVVHQGEGQQVRQVAHRGEHRSCSCGVMATTFGAAGLPGTRTHFCRLGASSPAAASAPRACRHVEVGLRGGDAALLSARRSGAPGMNVSDLGAQGGARAATTSRLGAAAVGDDRAAGQVRRHRGE
jgi:hypothetical protein